MDEYYVKYKRGDLEIEIKASDKEFIDQLLERLTSEVLPTQSPPLERSSITPKVKPKRKPVEKEASTDGDSKVDYAKITNLVHEFEEYSAVEENILNTNNRLGRILLAFKFAHEAGYPTITTGDVERITDQLGIKISTSNVSHAIKGNRKYFASDTAVKKGTVVPYKLNRQGEQAFDKCKTGEKLN